MQTQFQNPKLRYRGSKNAHYFRAVNTVGTWQKRRKLEFIKLPPLSQK